MTIQEGKAVMHVADACMHLLLKRCKRLATGADARENEPLGLANI